MAPKRRAPGAAFAGWGRAETAFVALDSGELVTAGGPSAAERAAPPRSPDAEHAPASLLGPWRSTSIAGNDLLSSCLYTAGICAGNSGKMAPLSLLLVSFMLYFFRFVYAEVVTAMPINGGSYTALSNTTSKRLAALAACLSLISYVATAVVSAEAAVLYVALLVPSAGIVDADTGACGSLCQLATVGVLGLFALLNLLGLSESANVATAMFAVHCLTLVVLVVWALAWAVRDDFALLRTNLGTDYPDAGGWPSALYFGYSSALLGITGFETAANYVEEMKDSKTYVATLRNMWVSVAFFNPVLGLLAMCVLPMASIYTYTSNLLGPMAEVVGGRYLEAFVCVDGAIVLAGSVLTAYVGVGGLMRRMAMDRCLPDFLLARNTLRGTHHWVILGFFGVASSLVFALEGDVQMLGSVYNIAFLSVMSAFAMACVVLKWKRPQLPRMVVASSPVVGLALVFVLAGLVGNIVREPQVLAWFALYFCTAALVVFSMFNRTAILRVLLVLLRSCLADSRGRGRATRERERLQRSHASLEAQLLKPGHSRLGRAVGIELDGARGGGVGDGDGDGGGNDGDSGGGRARFAAPAAGRESAGATSALLEKDADADCDEDEGDDYDHEFSGLTDDEGDEDDGARVVDDRGSLSGDGGSSSALLLPRALSAGGGAQGGAAQSWRGRLLGDLARQLEAVNSKPCVFFAKAADFETLNKAIVYVRANEQTSRLVVVYVADDTEAVASFRARGGALSDDPRGFRVALEASLPPLPAAGQLLREQVAVLDAIYPKLRVDFLAVRGTAFGPPVCRWLARHLGVGFNMMFMSSPDFRFRHRFSALGGLRIVTNASSRGVREAGRAQSVRVLKGAAGALSGVAVGESR
jgi:hypothetical protein